MYLLLFIYYRQSVIENDNLNKKISSINMQLESNLSKLNKLNEDKEMLESKNNLLSKQLHAFESNQNGLVQLNQTESSAISNWQQKYKNLMDQYESLSQEIIKKSNLNNENELEINKLENVIQMLNNKIALHEDDLRNSLSMKEAADSKVMDLQNLLCTMEMQWKLAASKASLEQKNLENTVVNKSHLEKELESCKLNLTTSIQNEKDMKGMLSEVIEERDDVINKLNHQYEVHAAAVTSYHQLSEQMLSLKQQNEYLEKRYKIIECDYISLQSSSNQAELKFNKLKEDYGTLQRKLAQQNNDLTGMKCMCDL